MRHATNCWVAHECPRRVSARRFERGELGLEARILSKYLLVALRCAHLRPRAASEADGNRDGAERPFRAHNFQSISFRLGVLEARRALLLNETEQPNNNKNLRGAMSRYVAMSRAACPLRVYFPPS